MKCIGRSLIIIIKDVSGLKASFYFSNLVSSVAVSFLCLRVCDANGALYILGRPCSCCHPRVRSVPLRLAWWPRPATALFQIILLSLRPLCLRWARLAVASLTSCSSTYADLLCILDCSCFQRVFHRASCLTSLRPALDSLHSLPQITISSAPEALLLAKDPRLLVGYENDAHSSITWSQSICHP